MQIPLPPFCEQQRLTSILDEAFTAITNAKEKIDKNLQNPRALFESHLQSVFTLRGSGWKEFRLGSIVKRLTNGYVGPTRNIYHDTGVPYLLARHVKNNRLTFDGKTYVSEAFNQKNKKSILKTGDVLLVQSGHIGHSAVVPPNHEGHNCHAMIVISPIVDIIDGRFLSFFFLSPSMQRQFEEMRTGSTLKHLNCRDIRELRVPLPQLAEQQRIVARLETLSYETKRLETVYQKKLSELNELKNSILQKAFTGELLRAN